MTETTATDLKELQRPVREMHRQFHTLVEPLRPDLFRYCLRLTGSPFDAEDLVQETLTRAFGRLFQFYQPLETRQYMFRIATNLWIDHYRRAQKIRFEPLDHDLRDDELGMEIGHDTRAALERIVDLLEPRQRVAVLLKDVFDFSIDEIATFLETTPGAVKALLHRGRTKIATSVNTEPKPTLDPVKLRLAEAYAERFSAQDWDGLVGLLRQDATLSIVGIDEEHGRDYIRGSSVEHTAQDILPGQRAEMVLLDGEPLVLWLFRPDDGPEAVRDVVRFDTDGAHITHAYEYWFCPDLVREVASRLGRRAEPFGAYTF